MNANRKRKGYVQAQGIESFFTKRAKGPGKVPTTDGSTETFLNSDTVAATSAASDSDTVAATSAASDSRTVAESFIPLDPYQPSPSEIPSQILPSGKTLHFQQHWYEKFPWLHYDINNKKVVCHKCATAKQNNWLDSFKQVKPCFVTTGFNNWKKALEQFKSHQNKDYHQHSLVMFSKRDKKNIKALISQGFDEQQIKARESLIKIVSSLKYLSGQGLAIQGHGKDDGNFKELLYLRGEDSACLKEWLCQQKQTFTSSTIQNEIIGLFSKRIIEDIVNEVNQQSKYFGIVVDGTQDINGVEQESICVRYVNDSLNSREEFLGLYSTDKTTGKAIADIVKDVLLRLQLPLANLRSQTYDGAANMAGAYEGCQAIIKKDQPKALYVHCGAHITHLVVSKAISKCSFIKDALDYLQQLGAFFQKSGKYKNLYLSVQDEDGNQISPKAIKPICPTRWLSRAPAVEAALGSYGTILESLSIAKSQFGSTTAAKASAIHHCMSSSKCVLGLVVAKPILDLFHDLNKSLQASTTHVEGMLKSVEMVVDQLQSFRNEDFFSELFEKAKRLSDQLELEPLVLRRITKRPARFDGTQRHTPTTPKEYYRSQFFELIDVSKAELTRHFSTPDLKKYQDMANMLFTGVVSEDILKEYPELNDPTFESQLKLYSRQYPNTTLEGHWKTFSNLPSEAKKLIPGIERLIRFLLIQPASACISERSLSALRRLKTWLRASMKQKRLNDIAVCHVHRNRLKLISCEDIAREFVNRVEKRRQIFGKF